MYKQITSNKRKSIALMFGFIFFYAGLGFVASLWVGNAAIFIAIGVAVMMVIFNLYMGDDLVVLVSGARQLTRKEEAPELWRMVENLAITSGLPMPRLYVIQDASPNAFAAGRNPKQAIVCCTTGLLERLDEEELEGVLAHEMSHVRNYDVRLMTWAAVLAGSIALLADILLRMLFFSDNRGSNPLVLVAVIVSAILAPIAAILIQMAISRKREFVADASGAELTRYPQGLASALETIAADQEPSPKLANNAIAHLMISPALKRKGNVSKMFSTHPPTEERVARLMEMAGGVPHQHESQTEGRAYAGLNLAEPADTAPIA
ncbi:MAG: M48 family metalloprotease [Solirubrobacterales bacterium]